MHDDELDLAQIWSFLCTWYRWLFAGGMLFALVALFVVFQLPNQYEGKALLAIPAPVGAQGGISIATGGATLDALVERFDLMGRYQVADTREAKIALSNRLKATANKDGLLELNVRDIEPEKAADLANALASSVRQQILDSHVTEQSKRLFVMRGRLDIARRDLDNAASAMEKMDLRNKLALDGNAEQILAGFAALDAQNALAENEGQTGKLLQLRADLERGNSSLSRLPGEQLKVLRDFYFNRAMVDELQKQVKVAQLQAAQDVQIVLAASVPVEKVGPKRGLIVILSGLVGLMAATGLCLALQAQRQRRLVAV